MTGLTDPWIERLSEYVDGDLDADTRTALEAHLASCAECRATRDELERVVARAQRIPYRQPAADLWSPIESAITVARTPARRRTVTLSFARLAAAAAFVAVVAGGFAWTIASRRAAERASLTMSADAAAPSITAATPPASALAIASYRDAAADLERVLEAGRSTLRPETMRVIEDNLRAMDVAIAQADSALRRDPGSAYLNQYLAMTMQRKLKLLRRAVEITSARS